MIPLSVLGDGMTSTKLFTTIERPRRPCCETETRWQSYPREHLLPRRRLADPEPERPLRLLALVAQAPEGPLPRPLQRARHSSVSWNLMTGKNILWVAKHHGHSVSTMLTTYAAWTEGATDADVEAIKRAMDQRPRAAQIVLNATPANPPAAPKLGKSRIQKFMVEREGLEPSTPAL